MRVLGVNTGTSVDSIDLCLVDWDINNLTNFKVLKSQSYEFTPSIKKNIEKLINKQDGHFEEISDLNFAFSKLLAKSITQFKNEYENESSEGAIELVGIHGQTIYHGEKSTWQLGNGSIVANLTGINVVSDFRSADMAVGGAGAPLTSFFDHIIMRHESQMIGTLNIGGIANISVMEPRSQSNESLDTVAYDTGPGNTLIDTLMKKLYQKDYDEDGELAFKGRVDQGFIDHLVNKTSYFSKAYPKTTGRELFDEKYAEKFLDLGNKPNIISTVSFFTVHTISSELKKFPELHKVYVSGGGVKNKFIMTKLKELNPEIEFLSHKHLNIDDQYKEAMLFSLLACTSYHGLHNNIPSSTGASKKAILGTFSYVQK